MIKVLLVITMMKVFFQQEDLKTSVVGKIKVHLLPSAKYLFESNGESVIFEYKLYLIPLTFLTPNRGSVSVS